MTNLTCPIHGYTYLDEGWVCWKCEKQTMKPSTILIIISMTLVLIGMCLIPICRVLDVLIELVIDLV